MLQAGILDILFTFLPATTLLALVVLIYYRGKRGNKKIVETETKKFAEAFSVIAEEIVQVAQSSSGFTYNVQLKKPTNDNDPLKNIRRLRIHFSLEDRQNLISSFTLLFKRGKTKDYIIIESDVKPYKNDHLNLEIIDWSGLGKYELKKFQEEWTELEDFEIKSEFSAKFYHKTNHPNALKHLYQKEPDLKKLIYNLPGLYRLSLKRKEDWGFRLAIRINKEMDYRIMRETTLRFMRGLSQVNQGIIKQPKRFLKIN